MGTDQGMGRSKKDDEKSKDMLYACVFPVRRIVCVFKLPKWHFHAPVNQRRALLAG